MEKIASSILKNYFDKLGIDKSFFIKFSDRANNCFEEIQGDGDSINENIEFSLERAKIFITQYYAQKKLGHSEQWSFVYADNYWEDSGQDSEFCAYESYKTVLKESEQQADTDLRIFAHSLSNDNRLIEQFIYYFKEFSDNPLQVAQDYLDLYDLLIDNGKSPIYAEQYARHYDENYADEQYWINFASKYEECIKEGKDNSYANEVACKYADYYFEYAPREDDYTFDIDFINSYIIGYQYALDNRIEPKESFAKLYQNYYCASIYPDDERYPCSFDKIEKYALYRALTDILDNGQGKGFQFDKSKMVSIIEQLKQIDFQPNISSSINVLHKEEMPIEFKQNHKIIKHKSDSYDPYAEMRMMFPDGTGDQEYDASWCIGDYKRDEDNNNKKSQNKFNI